MNRRHLIIVTIFVFALLAAWWWHTPRMAPEKSPSVRVTIPTPKPAASPMRATTAAGLAVAPASGSAARPSSPAPAANTDPRTVINAQLTKAIDRIQNDNLITVFETFVSPDELAQMSYETRWNLEQPLATHQGEPGIQVWLQVLRTMKDQTPAINEAGDRATYEIRDPTGQGFALRPIVLQKVGDQWYFTPTDIMRGVIGFGLTQNPPFGI